MNRPIIRQFDLTVGECTESRAYVYAPLHLPPLELAGKSGAAIQGHLKGPYCAGSTTLPATYPFIRVETAGGTLLRALITDPCPWSPERPMLYFAEITAAGPAGEQQRYRSTLAIRRLDARGRHLFLNGKRWVMRGIYDYGPVADVATWRKHAPVRVIRRHNSSVMAAAAELGLVVVYRLAAGSEKPDASIQSVLSPAVAMVVVPPAVKLSENIRSLAPNLLLAQEVSASEELHPWAHVAWMQAGAVVEFAKRSAQITIPIIAERRYHGTSLPEARDAIDTLQADLAPIGQFAGYVV